MPMVLFGSGINGPILIKVWFSLVSDANSLVWSVMVLNRFGSKQFRTKVYTRLKTLVPVLNSQSLLSQQRPPRVG
jgi:hypothetical protein